MPAWTIFDDGVHIVETLLFFLFFSLRYEMRKEKNFTFSTLFRPSVFFCSRYGYGKGESKISGTTNTCCFCYLYGTRTVAMVFAYYLFQISSSGKRELAHVRPYLDTWKPGMKIFLVRMPGGLALHPT